MEGASEASSLWTELPAVLRHWRIERRMTQRDLARIAGVAVRVVRTYETGTALPGLRTLERLLAALEVGLVELAEALSRSRPSAERVRYRRPAQPRQRVENDPSFVCRFAEALRWIRAYRKLSVAEVATAVGISESQLSRTERGLVEIKSSRLGKLLAVLDSDVIRLGVTMHLLEHGGILEVYTEDLDERSLVAAATTALGLAEMREVLRTSTRRPERRGTDRAEPE